MASVKTTGSNFSDDEIILTKYMLKCQLLEMQKMEMLRIKENLQILNVKSYHISKSLAKLRMECELHRADLSKTLFNLKLENDKRQILSRRKIKEFLEKSKQLEDNLKMSPFMLQLEELLNSNSSLTDQCKKVIFLLNLTKNQYEEIKSNLLKTFKMKVCEFCDSALRLKAINH